MNEYADFELEPRYGTPPVSLPEHRAREMAKAVPCRLCGSQPIYKDHAGSDRWVWCPTSTCFQCEYGSNLSDAVRQWNRMQEQAR